MVASPTPVDSVERLPGLRSSNLVSDELNKILTLLQDACPRDAQICFCFDGQLRVHIDVRVGEDLTPLQTLLPTLGAGLFHSVVRGATPHRSFFHRISAVVER